MLPLGSQGTSRIRCMRDDAPRFLQVCLEHERKMTQEEFVSAMVGLTESQFIWALRRLREEGILPTPEFPKPDRACLPVSDGKSRQAGPPTRTDR